eukprot:g4106.t1
MPETPAVVKHAGSTYPIALPDVAECGAVSSWVRTLHERVAAVTGVPAASQRLLCKAWKGRLHESIFKSVDKCAKKIAKQSSKAAKLGSPIALMVFDEERSHDVKVALGHATPLQLFEEDVRAAVRRTSERDDAAANITNIDGVDANTLSSPSSSPTASQSSNSRFIAMLEANEARAFAVAEGIRVRALWKRKSQQLHNKLNDAFAEWKCDSCAARVRSAM